MINYITIQIRIVAFRGIASSLIALMGMLATPVKADLVAAAPPTTRPSLTVPHTGVAPRVDAVQADPVWRNAARIDSLSLCVGPQAAALQPSPTEIRVLWDEQFLYVRFICQDADIYAPHGTQRDAMHSEGDVVEVFIDPRGDSRQFVELQLSPAGGVLDAVHVLTTQPTSGPDDVLSEQVLNRDAWFILGWDMKGLRTAAAETNEAGMRGWIADLAIPAEPLLRRTGLRRFEPMTLRANFLRYDRATPARSKRIHEDVFMNWSPVAWGRPHRSPAAMGTLILQP